MVLEIYKLVPGANIEQYEKRVMKTINSILKQNENLDIIDTDIEESQNNGESNYDIDQLDKIFSSEKVS